jgi:hypothetical protein
MQRTFFTLALLIGLLIGGGAHSSEAGDRTPSGQVAVSAINVSGSYTSNWGQVTLRQNGKRITGSYSNTQHGTLEGTLEGNVFRYTWHENQTTGHGVFVVATNHELIGTWGVDGDDISGGGWRLTPAKQIASLAK